MDRAKQDYELIENHGIIGNMRTAALVSLNGCIDFLCVPRFDAPAVFAALLDQEHGGHFSISPQMEGSVTKQLYIPGTAILITRFFAEAGIVEITDYMPVREDTCSSYNAIVRKVRVVRGNIDFRVCCSPRFNYARSKHHTTRRGNEVRFHSVKSQKLVLRLSSDMPLKVADGEAHSSFRLKETEVVCFVLESVDKGSERDFAGLDFFREETYFETISFWRKWLSQSTYKGRWQEIVNRSVITLKLLTSVEHGSVVAAATFGLPEELGGDRNWDYRYSWIRDAAFSMFAFLKLGFYKEANDFLQWIIRQAKDRELHLIYRVDGSADLQEKILPGLAGYKHSGPVRTGNQANEQVQMDIHGELLDTIYLYNQYQPITHELWAVVVKEVDIVIRNWKKADHGIWEIRGRKQQFLHTRLMCWVALDRAIRVGTDRSFPFPAEAWEKVRNEIYKDIFNNFWNEELQSWVQYKEGKKAAAAIDASVLMMPLLHFVTPQEPRWRSTMEAIDKQLRLDVLVYRYRNHISGFDGLDGEEGTFTMCSFWYIECLAKDKQLDRAVENFEKMLGYANHLGLFSEQISKKGEHLGNFPQAFTHLALISAALEMDKQLNRQHQ